MVPLDARGSRRSDARRVRGTVCLRDVARTLTLSLRQRPPARSAQCQLAQLWAPRQSRFAKGSWSARGATLDRADALSSTPACEGIERPGDARRVVQTSATRYRARACVNFRARAVATANGWFRPDVVVIPVHKSRHPPRRAPEGAQTHTTERVEDPRERVARASAEVSERVRATSARSTSATRPGPEERGARIPGSDPLARLDADRGWRPHCSRRWPAG